MSRVPRRRREREHARAGAQGQRLLLSGHFEGERAADPEGVLAPGEGVTGVAGQPRVVDGRHLRMGLEELGDALGAGAVPLHAQRERLEPPVRQVRVAR